jgi:dihydropteroate synthase
MVRQADGHDVPGIAVGRAQPFARPVADWVRLPVEGVRAPEAERAVAELAERTGGWVEPRPGGRLEVIAPVTGLASALEGQPGLRPAPDALPDRPTWGNGALAVTAGGRVVLMAVLNVTPDSFSDGGRWLDPSRAAQHAGRLARDGAEVIDVGGESTRPGHVPVPPGVEWARIAPVLSRLAPETSVTLSVDTRHGEVARRALAAGCRVVNDVTGGRDPDLLAAVAEADALVVLGHWQEPSAAPRDVVARVLEGLGASLERAMRAGIPERHVALDPGFGFGKGPDANWMLLRQLALLRELGRPIVVGLSRKRFLTAVSGPDLDRRDQATAAAAVLAVEGGADVLRVHNPGAVTLAVRVAERFAGRDGVTAP